MKKYFKTTSLALLLAALFILFSPGTVFADDGGPAEETPQPTISGGEVMATEEPLLTETPVVEETPIPEVTVTEPSTTGDPLLTETPAAEETPIPEVTVTEPPITGEPLLTETPALEETPTPEEELPSDGEVILTNEEGDSPVLGGDPYFMVGTQKYAWVFDIDATPGWQSDCPVGTTPNVTCFEATGTGTLATVLEFIDTNGLVPTDKKIYVESGTYNEGPVGFKIDGTTSIFLKQLNGLIGVDGADVTTINGNINIKGTTGGFTLSGFTINGGAIFTSVVGNTVLTDLDMEYSSTHGILIQDQRGAVTLTDVQSNNHSGIGGLFIDNSIPGSTYPVSITNSEFNDNELCPMIFSNGVVTVNGVSAGHNNGCGLYIDTRGAVTVKNGVFSDNVSTSKDYPQNYGIGLYIQNQATTAAVNLENIQATGNEDIGVWVRSIGPVTVKTLAAANNTFQGLLIADDPAVVSALASTTVSISDSVFTNNRAEGLRVHAKGNVTLSYVNASNNAYEGVFIDNCLWDSGTAKCLGAGSVTVLNPYQTPMDFNVNGSYGTYDGLFISSANAVTLTGISARWNSGSGLYVVNNYPGKTGGVTLNSLPEVLAYPQQNKFDNNSLFGLNILSNGPVAINGKTSSPMRIQNNAQGGIMIGDNTAPSGNTVKITGVNLFLNGDTGVTVYSKGAITLDSVYVDQSWSESYGGKGFNLNNTFGSGAISVSNAAANYIDEYGFYITSNGAVTLTSVNVYQPGQRGIYIDNSSAVYAQPVKLTDVNVERAHGNGIEIFSKGAVTLNGVNSAKNAGMMLPSYQSVDVTGYVYESTWFNFMGEAGAEISITLNYTGYASVELYDASYGNLIWSDGSGYWSDPFESGVLTLPTTGEYYLSLDRGSDWQQNFTYALNYRYNATIPYSSSAPSNTGIYIDNTSGLADVTIQKSINNSNPWVSHNTGNGIYVRSKGNIKLLNATLHANQGDGAILDNSVAPSAKTVTAGSLDIYHSGGTGLRITSIGAVVMSSIISNENAVNGIEVVNCLLESGKCKGIGAVSLTGSNQASNNGGYGVNIYTIGLVTLNNMDVYGNPDMGIYINAPAHADLTVIPTGGGVTMTSSGGFTNTIGNTYNGTGLYIYTYGPVSFTNLDVYQSNSNGMVINNRYAASNQPVTLTNVSVSRSGSTGIDIQSKGTVTLNGVSSSSNAYKNLVIGYGETIEGLGNGDFFLNFDVSEGSELVIDFCSDGFRGSIYLYDENWNWLGSADVEPYEPITIDAGLVSGGTYILEAYSWYSTPYWYQLSVSDAEGIVDHDYSYPAPGITINNSHGTGDVNLGKSATGNANYIYENTGYGLFVTTNGKVNLGYVYVARNLDQGISINSATQAKTITITDITVEDNQGNGVTINTAGPVTWTSGSIMNNLGYGVTINNMSSTAAAPITLSKVKVNSSNSGAGLTIYGKGAVTLTDVEAINNLKNGISVTTYGAITLNRVSAIRNFDPENYNVYGAYLDNTISTSLIPAGVTITDSDFNYNSFGLRIDSRGAVSLKGVDVEGNYDRGQTISLDSSLTANLPGMFEIYLENYGWINDGDESNWTFTVTEPDYDLALTVYMDFDGNWALYDSDNNYVSWDYTDGNDVPHYILQPGDYRIRVYSYYGENGGMYQIGLNVDPETAFPSSYANGAEINTDGNVTVARSAVRAMNNFNRNGWNGLRINTKGSVTLSDIKANENLFAGIYINGQTLGKAVTLNRVVLLENYYKSTQISTYGPVSWNTGQVTGSIQGASISNNLAALPQAVTITKVGFNDVRNNSGLTIFSAGNVSLTGVGAMWNSLNGFYIDNTAGTGSVTVNNTTGEWIGGNGSNGLYIRSKGVVTLTNVGAGKNSGNGIYVNNEVPSDTVKPGVNLVYTLDRWVDTNGFRGIEVISNGPIKLTTTKKLNIESNSVDGVVLKNSQGGTSVGITVAGVLPGQINITNSYNGSGLVVFTQGAAVISNVSANYSLNDGILVGNESGLGKPSSVKLTNIVIEGAGDEFTLSDGVHVIATGPVTVDKIQSVFPYGDGLDITSTSGVVTVKRAYMWSNGNYDKGFGIRINSAADVILDSILSSSNDRNLYVNTIGAVTLLGTYYKNEFNGSTVGDSIIIFAGAGGITLNRLDIIGNHGGVSLITDGKITINNALVRNNMYGISGLAGTGATITKVFSMNNGFFDASNDGLEEFYDTDGIFLQLNSGTASFTDSSFMGNSGSGIEVYFADPAITARPYPLVLLRTLYFGNDSDYSGDANLYTYDS